MKIFKTKISKVAILLIAAIVATIVLINSNVLPLRERDNMSTNQRLIAGDTLSCTIILDNKMNTASPALKFATNMVKKFSEQHFCTIDVGIEKNSVECWDKLIGGDTDVIIVSKNDSIPFPYSDYIESSMEIEKQYICAVKLGNEKVLNSINYWITHFCQSSDYKKQLAWLQKSEQRLKFSLPRSRYSISPYDSLVKIYSKSIGWDWRLFSALMYQESKFNQGVVSRMGAIGLMQVMESTALRMGIEDVYEPEQNIKAGSKELARLQNRYKKMGADSANVILLTLAAYNCGDGKIQHCMKVAKAEGKDPLIWENLASVIPMMSNGYTNGDISVPPFRGRESIVHVENIIRQWEFYQRTVVR